MSEEMPTLTKEEQQVLKDRELKILPEELNSPLLIMNSSFIESDIHKVAQREEHLDYLSNLFDCQTKNSHSETIQCILGLDC